VNVALILDHACNLRCGYCFGGRKFSRPMPADVSDSALDLLFADASAGDERVLTFFGGEPLLHFDRIRQLTLRAQQRADRAGVRLRLMLVTNATRIDASVTDFLAGHGFQVAVSVDGGPAAHDANRRFPNGRPSYAAVERGVRLLLDRAPDLWVRAFAVIHPANVSHLADSIDALLDLGLWDQAFNLDVHPRWRSGDRARFDDAITAAGDRYIQAYRDGRQLALNLFDSKIVTGLTSRPHGRPRCNFGCLEVFVAPSGRLYPCDRVVREDDDDTFVIGDVRSGIDTARRDALVQAKDRMNDDCLACDLRARCVHWCGCVNWLMTGDVGDVDGVWCWFEQRQIEEADRCASVLYAERNPGFLDRFYAGDAR